MINLDRVKPSYEFLSNAIGISSEDVQKSFAKLLQLKLIIPHDSGYHAKPFYSAGDVDSNVAIRNFHKIMIERAKECIELLPVDERYLFSVIFTGNKDNYKDRCRQIQEFANSISDDSADQCQNNQVFGLTLQFFPLSTEF